MKETHMKMLSCNYEDLLFACCFVVLTGLNVNNGNHVL